MLVPSWRLPYTAALEAWDSDALVDQLSDDVTIHVAVHDAPLHGRDVAGFLFRALIDELSAPRITDEIVEGSKGVVIFDTRIRDVPAQGLTVVDLDGNGRTRELTLFIRTLHSLEIVAEVVGERLAEELSPPM